MLLRNIIGELYSLYNPKIAENWDNVGLLVGNKEAEIKKILFCLDVTEKAVERAIEEKVDLIISHHPFIFNGMKRITDEDIHGRKVLRLIENKIAVYSGHTNVDFGLNGLNDFILYKLNLEGRVEIHNEFEFDDYNHIKHINEKVQGGRGRIKILNREIELKELINVIKSNLGIPFIRYAGADRKIKRIGIVVGGGSSFVHELKEKIDVFLTGDLRHHESLDTIEEGGILVDIGHYESEYLFVELMAMQVSQFFNGEIVKYFDEPVFKLG